MTAEQFAYWMQGFAELNSAPPNEEQWQMIRDHLQTVFHKVTPNYKIPQWPATGPFSPDTSSAPRVIPLTATCVC